MGKRRLQAEERDTLPRLQVCLRPSAHASDPFSHGEATELYSVDALKKVAIEKHRRTDEFEKRLMGIWWAIGAQAVPFVFETMDGQLRSMDAGCLGFLVNRWRPDVTVETDADGFVVAVTPAAPMIERYEPIRARLIAAVSQ